MRVKAIIKYTDSVLKRNVEAGDVFEVDTEERLQELLGKNKKKIVCVEVLPAPEEEIKAEKETTPEATKPKPKGKLKNAKKK